MDAPQIKEKTTGMKAILFNIAVNALKEKGWDVTPVPGSGKGSVRRITRGKESRLVSIRTTQDTWIAFPRDAEDKKWGTLCDVDDVVAVSVDDRYDPRFAQVHLLDGNEMRKRFDRAYEARKRAGHMIRPGHGVWVGLYTPEAEEPPTHVGSGVGLLYPPIARVSLSKSESKEVPEVDNEVHCEENFPSLTIVEAKKLLAKTYGVDPSNIKIIIEG